MTFCSNCGTQLTDEQVFCPTCANNVRCIKKTGFIDAYIMMWTHVFDFKGRARRCEYWYALMANTLIFFILSLLRATIPAMQLVSVIYGLIVLIPSLALSVRRLHDIGRSGHWLWLILTVLGVIVLFVFCCQDKKQPINKYGHSPKWHSVYDFTGGENTVGNI